MRDAVALGVQFNEALSNSDWPGAVRALTEMPAQDRSAALGQISPDARGRIRDAAWALDPNPGNVVVQAVESVETRPASAGPAAPAAARPAGDIASLSATEKLGRAWDHARSLLGESLAGEIQHLFSRQSLAMLAVFAGIFIAAQLTPAGWVADALALTTITITAFFVGMVIFEVARLLVRFFSAVNATTEADLRASGQALADAIAKAGVAVIVALITRGMRGRGGGRPMEGPPRTGYADAVTPEGFVIRMPVPVAQQIVAAGPTTLQQAASFMVAAPPPGSTGGAEPPPGGGGGSGGPRGEEVFAELTDELTMEAGQARSPGVAGAVADAEGAGLTGPRGAPGTADLAVQPHGSASGVRGAQGVSGTDVQSAHLGPTSALRGQAGYSRGGADTVLLDRNVHAALDGHWKQWAQAQRRAGRTEVPASELYRVMIDAIDQTPGITQRMKNAMSWRLELELYGDLGLTPASPVTLPYPNIPAAAP